MQSQCLFPRSLKATEYGPRCPQKVDQIHCLMENMFEKLSSDQWCDEFGCLHLNVYAPPVVAEEQQLPVFAWVHGGAFNNGDNTTEFDENHLVRRSMSLGHPIIVVTINYRLNVLGFSASKELVQEATQQGKLPVFNQGLRDQRLGLQWIQDHIHLFGGNPSRVTLGGESAGAASVFYHLRSTQPLFFHQAFIQSSPLPQLRSFEEAQKDFDDLVEAAGASSHLSGQEKLAQLRKLSSTEITALFSGKVSTPIADTNWFVGPLPSSDDEDHRYWANLPPWCHRVILGHTKDEASLFLAPLLAMPLDEIRVILAKAAKGFDIDLLAKFDSTRQLVQFLNSIVTLNAFTRPCLDIGTAAAANNGSKVFVHEFAVSDPFPGPLNGFAWHSIGNPILFYQPPCRRDSGISKTADQFSESFVRFLHGGEPWQALNEDNKKMVFNGAQSGLVEAQPVAEAQVASRPAMGLGFVMSLLESLA